MERHSRSLRSQEGKTRIQKPLCRLCECPTSDGHVLASRVDRFKLRKWAMEVMYLTEEDENLPDVVEEEALICYFCIWQAEFGDESGDEAVAWWPKNLDLEENARVLRESYSVGDVEQCWVQLEEIDLAEYEKEIPKRNYGSKVCLYCGKRYDHLTHHVKYMHKEAIKCGIRGCTTFFHTVEEKEHHMQHDFHEKGDKPGESSKIRCKFCENGILYSSRTSWRVHVNRMHPELVACSRVCCIEYFKSKPEMMLHINSFHKKGINHDLFECKLCDYFTTTKHLMVLHQQSKHMPKMFKCDSCDASFGSKYLVNSHYKKFHTFDVCKSCGQDVAHGYKAVHRRPSVCTKCKLKFKCSGLYQLHRKSCKQAPYSCKECGESFTNSRKLIRHVRRFHPKTPNIRCDHCDYSTFEKRYMGGHMQYRHLPKTIKCGECNHLFASESFLKEHKYMRHEYVHCAECAQEMSRQNMLRHRTVKTCRQCKCTLNCSGLVAKHVCPQGNNFFCDKCPKVYRSRRILRAHIVRMHIKIMKNFNLKCRFKSV
ncbi:zinc finger protein 814-like [Cloeon dipterum]|uniref:zinc finger protein 814-like n=1 Tax=Cloeon dipterum TaxID=197152 RepID=UPI00321FB175